MMQRSDAGMVASTPHSGSSSPCISIIIPVYKVEQYLRECLESVTRQTFHDFEVIIIDDGSPDQCGLIAEDYSKKDGRFRVLHRENGGLSAARNTGLAVANGRYVTFIDSDDVVSESYLENLLLAIGKNGCRVSAGRFVRFEDGDCPRLTKFIDCVHPRTVDADVAIKMIYETEHSVAFTTWGKLYDRMLFDEAKVVFPEGRLHEDDFTTYRLLYHAGKVAFADLDLYGYRVRSSGIMGTPKEQSLVDSLEARQGALRFFSDLDNPDLMSVSLRSLLLAYINAWSVDAVRTKEYKVVTRLNIRKNYRDAVRKYGKYLPYRSLAGLAYRLFPICPNIVSLLHRTLDR